MLLIKNGHIIDPKTNRNSFGDVLVRDGIVAKIEGNINEEDYPGIKVINAQGCIVSPGFVDVHSHFRDPGFTEKETIATGAAAAAAGGYTSVVCMANTDPVIDSVSSLNYVLGRFENETIHIYQDSALTVGRQGKRLVDMKVLKDAGAVGFTDDGSPVLDETIVSKAMAMAQELNVPLSFHEEDPSFVYDAGINQGDVAEKLGLKGASRFAEISLTDRDLKLALRSGASIDIQHVSAAETVELIRKAKAEEAEDIIHAEATPHHFSLTEEAIIEYGTNAKVNPPLRTEKDRMAIIGALADGTIDIIATDHAPHTAEQKKKTFTGAPSGIIGLETALSLAITKLVRPGYIDVIKMIELMSTNPAGLYHLKAGSIAVGMPADIAVFNPDEVRVVTKFFSRSSNSPFIGSTLFGSVHYTVAAGKIAYDSSMKAGNE